ncbi:MAG: TolC family protein [Prevotella sp.]|nr:TolC family protein [Prevotella sp.]
MGKFRKVAVLFVLAVMGTNSYAQFNESGISAGFFDSSGEKSVNFSEFHLPPLAVLFENAKESPQILSLAKAQEIAEAEVVKQKKHIFSYIYGHASYSYGKTDLWGNNSSTYNTMIYQFQGSEQSYWNVGVNLSVPLEDVLDLGHSVKRKRLLVEDAQIKKDIAYEQLKLQIATLYTRITNGLVSLKTASENAAIYQGAGALNLEDFHNGNMNIEDFAWTKRHEEAAVRQFQDLQTQLITDILTLEIITHTPILTNSTTEITLDSTIHKSAKEQAKENKAVEKRIKKAVEAEEKRLENQEKAEKKAIEEEAKKKAKAEKDKSKK